MAVAQVRVAFDHGGAAVSHQVGHGAVGMAGHGEIAGEGMPPVVPFRIGDFGGFGQRVLEDIIRADADEFVFLSHWG